MLRVLSLFSGIGGIDLGLERTGGFRTVRFVEWDRFKRAVLAKHWPSVPCDEDITTVEFSQGEADVICGGFPCPDISNAGKRAGITGERSGLWRELVRAIRVVRPLRILVENVAALLGRGMGTVLGDLAEVGYDAEWNCIPASRIKAPHHRDRIWIVAYPHKAGRARLVQSLDTSKAGSWGWRGETDLRALRPFEPGHMWPQPLIRRMDDGVRNRIHRIGAMGDAVVPQIPEMIGLELLKTMHL